jgi:hypothetical protein
VVLDDGQEAVSYPHDVVRITVSWKAEVYPDDAAAAQVDEHSDDLTLEGVVDTFLADLDRRGCGVSPPTDPLSDEAWVSTLADAYRESAPRIP